MLRCLISESRCLALYTVPWGLGQAEWATSLVRGRGGLASGGSNVYFSSTGGWMDEWMD